MKYGRITRLLKDVKYMFDFSLIEDPKFSLDRLPEARRYFDDHGWVIIRGVFSPDEIQHFRNAVLKSEQEGQAGDLLSNPHLASVVADQRVGKIVNNLLSAPPVYFGDSSWNSGRGYSLGTGFHKDNPDRQRHDAPDWQSPYSILRCGIYLQDCAAHSGGLGIRDRSHNTVDTTVGRPLAVPAEIGDVVIWSLRTSHSGFVSRLRLFKKIFFPIGLQTRLTVKGNVYAPGRLFIKKEKPERLALFLTYGIDDHHLQRYIRYLKTRQYAVQMWRDTKYTCENIALLKSSGINFLDLSKEGDDIDLESLHIVHQELSAS